MAASLLAALTGFAAFTTPALADERHSFVGKRTGGRSYDFALRHLRPSSVLSGELRVGSWRRSLDSQAIRRALASGHLRLRLPRAEAAAARRWPPRVHVATRDFARYDGFSTFGGSLTNTRATAYDGSKSIKATYRGSHGPGFQRVWRDVQWSFNWDVWYGLALFIPDVTAFCYWNPMRWDNYKTYGRDGDVGGLSIQNGLLSLFRGDYGGAELRLTEGVRIPERRWFWVEVHQRLSASGDVAVSELYIDGAPVAASHAPNSRGRRIDHLRFGVVNVATSCSRPGSVFFDRAGFSAGLQGPLHQPDGAPFRLSG